MSYLAQYDLENFELYNASRRLRKKTYEFIKQLPAEEKYCLGSQMRRAAVSVSNNIAEGHGRWHYLENVHFCCIARGSIDELIDDYNTCTDEGYGQTGFPEELKKDARQLIAKVNSYILYLRNSKQGDKSKTK
jgi:four helix bundle protein